GPFSSTAVTSARPLIELCRVSKKLPGCAALGCALVFQWMRSMPLSLVKESVCWLPEPDHSPSLRQVVCCCAGAAFAGAAVADARSRQAHDASSAPKRKAAMTRGRIAAYREL